MNPITHFLISWNIAEVCNNNQKDTILITAGGIIPDIDGLGAIGDMFSSEAYKLTHTSLYEQYHHILCHNITFCAICLIFVLLISKRKLITAALFTLTFHLHLLCDILGSGGGDGYRWPIPYLYPFSTKPQLEWTGQWQLASWQNLVITLIFMITSLFLIRKKGSSPIGWISPKADKELVKTIRNRLPLN